MSFTIWEVSTCLYVLLEFVQSSTKSNSSTATAISSSGARKKRLSSIDERPRRPGAVPSYQPHTPVDLRRDGHPSMLDRTPLAPTPRKSTLPLGDSVPLPPPVHPSR